MIANGMGSNTVYINDGGGGSSITYTTVGGSGSNGEVISLIPEQVDYVHDILEQNIEEIETMAEELIAWDNEQYSAISSSKYAYLYPKRYSLSEIEPAQDAFYEARRELSNTVDYINQYANASMDEFDSQGGNAKESGIPSSDPTPPAGNIDYGSVVSSEVMSPEEVVESVSNVIDSSSQSGENTNNNSQSNQEQTDAGSIIGSQLVGDDGSTSSSLDNSTGNINIDSTGSNADGESGTSNQLITELGINSNGGGNATGGSLVGTSISEVLGFENGSNSILGNSTGSLLSGLSRDDFINSKASISSGTTGSLIPSSLKKFSKNNSEESVGNVGVIATGSTVTLGSGAALLGGVRYYNKKKQEEIVEDIDDEEEKEEENVLQEENANLNGESIIDFKEHLLHLGENEEEEAI